MDDKDLSEVGRLFHSLGAAIEITIVVLRS